MNLYLQFPTNLKLLELYSENKEYIIGFNSKNEREIAHFFLQNFPGEVMNEQSPQYELNFLGIRKLKKIDKNIFNKVRGIYYGTDSCEYLMPTKEEIEKAITLFNKIRKRDSIEGNFILNTPYLGGKMLERAKETIDFLAKNYPKKYKIEIVINDLGLLRYVKQKYNDLFPITFGRVIYKLLKTPLVDIYGNQAKVSGKEIKNKSPEEIKLKQEEIIKWQNKYYNSSEVSFSPFKKVLEKNNIKRITLDFIEGRKDLYKEKYPLDLHFPYALIFTGRLCDTSAIENPDRGNYAINEICSRTCFRYDLGFKIKSPNYHLIQKGNAGYRTSYDLDKLPKEFLEKKDNRLIFSPFL